MTPILRTEGLSHRYTTGWAIRDIDIEIDQTGIIGLVGSNGAGKSTTMNIVCGVLKQTQGHVYIDGAEIRQQPEAAKRNIGFLPQQPPLYTDLTVHEYLTYCAQLHFIEKNKIRSAVSRVEERCGISHVSNRLIKNLSGGYRQRVGIAQAIIHAPKLVVMDEPTNGLDPNQLIEMRKLIQEISQECSVLWSSHILSEIRLLCREIIMIEGGRIVFSDSIDAFNNYAQANTILMQLENPPAMEEIMKIPGVVGVEIVSEKLRRISFEGDQTITEKLIAASVSAGWRLQEINVEKVMLDDTFKKISNHSH